MFDNIEVGKRIEEYRNRKGWTQKDLADRMDMSRSSITQIEKGKRNVTAIELFQFSKELEFPVAEFFSDQSTLGNSSIDLSSNEEPEIEERVSVPSDQFRYDKFKNILLYILEKCAGKPNVGETVLYKLLYFADFNYFEKREAFLTGATYRKLPYGPVPLHLDQIFEKMIDEGEVQRIKTEYYGYPQTRYIPLNKADLEKISGAEKETLDQVIEQFSDWSASSISDFSHKDIPWKATSDGEVIDYELAFYREPPFSAKTYDYEKPENSDV